VSAPICDWCEEPVLNDDRRAPNYVRPTHYECGLRAAIGSVGHQKMRCFCFGGEEEDPPGLSRRQAAMAAALFFHLGTVPDHLINPQPTES
jgi:hypothetical protein